MKACPHQLNQEDWQYLSWVRSAPPGVATGMVSWIHNDMHGHLQSKDYISGFWNPLIHLSYHHKCKNQCSKRQSETTHLHRMSREVAELVQSRGIIHLVNNNSSWLPCPITWTPSWEFLTSLKTKWDHSAGTAWGWLALCGVDKQYHKGSNEDDDESECRY